MKNFGLFCIYDFRIPLASKAQSGASRVFCLIDLLRRQKGSGAGTKFMDFGYLPLHSRPSRFLGFRHCRLPQLGDHLLVQAAEVLPGPIFQCLVQIFRKVSNRQSRHDCKMTVKCSQVNVIMPMHYNITRRLCLEPEEFLPMDFYAHTDPAHPSTEDAARYWNRPLPPPPSVPARTNAKAANAKRKSY